MWLIVNLSKLLGQKNKNSMSNYLGNDHFQLMFAFSLDMYYKVWKSFQLLRKATVNNFGQKKEKKNKKISILTINNPQEIDLNDNVSPSKWVPLIIATCPLTHEDIKSLLTLVLEPHELIIIIYQSLSCRSKHMRFLSYTINHQWMTNILLRSFKNGTNLCAQN